jgi:ATPase subunit of ABC transporter with duplicated ATPase domains
MIQVNNVSLSFGKRVLFKDVNIKFTPGNCYGLIGANGAGKSTFLKILSGEIEAQKGEIFIEPNKRLSVLEQNQFKYDDNTVIETVTMGNKKLFEIAKKREELYSKSDLTEEEGNLIGEIESEFAEMNGYEAESEAASLLNGLDIKEDLHDKTMKELESGEKVRVLLAQAIFGNPDILLLDEPTNNLDIRSISWLENFLSRFNNTVIVVSHDRHFLNNVCTHIADLDFQQLRIYNGNYEFWNQAAQLAMSQKKEQNKRNEEKVKELEDFIRRFSANVAKSRQATSRRKMIDKLSVEDIPHTSRRFPYIEFKPDREVGNIILNVENLNKTLDGVELIKDFSLTVNPGDKIAFIGKNDLIRTTFFQLITGEIEADSGDIVWGQTITKSFFPKDNEKYFNVDINLIEWLRQYSKEKDETYIRGFLGRMLFSGEESLKKATVLSGGEKVRCMLSMMMCSGANVLVMDEPTNHLDLESITSLNNSLIKYNQVLLFSSQDHEFVQSTANRIIEFGSNGYIDKMMTYDEYLEDADVERRRIEIYS